MKYVSTLRKRRRRGVIEHYETIEDGHWAKPTYHGVPVLSRDSLSCTSPGGGARRLPLAKKATGNPFKKSGKGSGSAKKGGGKGKSGKGGGHWTSEGMKC